MTEYPVINTGDDVSGQELVNHADPLVVAFTLDANTTLHTHRHIRSTFVESDRFRFTVDGQSCDVGPGDSYVVNPSDAVHGSVSPEVARLMDCFTPRRDDFL